MGFFPALLNNEVINLVLELVLYIKHKDQAIQHADVTWCLFKTHVKELPAMLLADMLQHTYLYNKKKPTASHFEIKLPETTLIHTI